MSRTVRVYNRTQKAQLAATARVADTLVPRLRGLLFRPALKPEEGLVLDPCNSIHMWFMRYPIDVLFIDAKDAVVAAVEGIRPWRMTRIYWDARRAIELPSGRIAETSTDLGDTIDLQPVFEQ